MKLTRDNIETLPEPDQLIASAQLRDMEELWIARDNFTSTQYNRVGSLYLYVGEPKEW